MSLRWPCEADHTGEERYKDIGCLLRNEIRVRFHLDFHRLAWIDGWEINHLEIGEMWLSSSSVDQPELAGIL